MSNPAPPTSSTAEYYQPLPLYVPPRARQRTWIYVFFFCLTVLTTLIVGTRMELNFQKNIPPLSLDDNFLSVFPWSLRHPGRLVLGIPFSFTLMLILFAHEMGHYLYCRYYGVNATLPFFVPFPSLFGTMGAFIRIKSPIPSRSALFDIGIAGPIAGFVFAILALGVGLVLSKPMPAVVLAPDLDFGYPLIFKLVHRLVGARTELTKLNLSPVAIAAWVGMFATALNLLPGGQLDGGHIVFSISPRLHRIISTATIATLVPLGFYRWTGWLLWAVLLAISGMRHPTVPSWPSISGGRRWLAIFAIIMLVMSFTPTPLTHSSLREVIEQLWPGK
ncbi:MAG: site-2 protease family protein [Acidobacteria bacterium]|nr:site-2 protease family protein [Acidobacteriota bacterium]